MIIENSITSEIAGKQRQLILNTKKLGEMRDALCKLGKNMDREENKEEENTDYGVQTNPLTLNGMMLLFINMKELISQTLNQYFPETDNPDLEIHYRWLQKEMERIAWEARNSEQALFLHYTYITGMIFISFQYLFFFFIQILIYHHLVLSANCIHLLTIWLH